MRKDSLTILCTTAVSGAIGMFVRWLQVTNIFDAETELAARGATVSWVFVLLCVAVVAMELLLTLRLRYCRAETDYHTALHGRSLAFPAFSGVMGCLCAVGGIVMAVQAFQQPSPVLQLLLAVMGVLAGLALVWLGVTKNGGQAMSCLCAVVPVLFYCFWLIVCYKDNSNNPVIWAYCIQILAIAAAIIAWYFVAGYAFGRPRPMKTLFFCQLAAFLGIVSMGDNLPLSERLLLLCPSLILLATASVLVRNLRRS